MNNDEMTPDQVASDDDLIRQRREQERKMNDVQRKIHEAKRAQDAAVDAGEPMRRADAATTSPTDPQSGVGPEAGAPHEDQPPASEGS